MSLFQDIQNYTPENEQEARDREVMLQFMSHSHDYLNRSNMVAHFSASTWTVNKERTKTLPPHPVVAWRSPAGALLHPPPRRRAAGSPSTSPSPLLDQ